MGAPLAPLDISSKEVIRLMRAWGWSFVAEGVKEAKFKKGDNRLAIRRKEKADADGPTEAARIEGISLAKWLAGPIEGSKVKGLSDEDLTWFTQHDRDDFAVGTRELGRWRSIRDVLLNQGLLKQYAKVQREVVAAAPAPVEPIKPLEVEVDTSGYISLDDALALIGKKQTTITRTSSEIIAALSLGDIADDKGKATNKLLDLLPDRAGKVASPGLSMALKQMERSGLIWREMPHSKSTNKIGLCMPVLLTPEEKVKYLKPEPVVADPFPEHFEPVTLVPEPVDIIIEPEIPEDEVGITTSPAIEILEAEAAELQLRLDHIHFAIDILKNH